MFAPSLTTTTTTAPPLHYHHTTTTPTTYATQSSCVLNTSSTTTHWTLVRTSSNTTAHARSSVTTATDSSAPPSTRWSASTPRAWIRLESGTTIPPFVTVSYPSLPRCTAEPPFCFLSFNHSLRDSCAESNDSFSKATTRAWQTTFYRGFTGLVF